MRILGYGIALVILVACSTEKNRLINRSYHGLTAHYNGYFNANELLSQAMTSYRSTLKEDYYNLLTLLPYPNEDEVRAMYPAIDTAIAKCTKVISKHSMPTASEPEKKKEEHNAWIDENWMTIGIANFYRRDYDGAIKNFKYIKKFFVNDPSNYDASIWMAKSYIKINKLTEASILIQALDKDLEKLEELEKNKQGFFQKLKKSGKKKRKKRKSDKKEEEMAKFSKKSKYLLELTRYELQLAMKDKEKAIEALEASLKFCKKSAEKARIHYVLAQLKAENQKIEAAGHYSKVLRYNSPFAMNFSARINRAILNGNDKTKKELEKMLRDAKNAEYKDQIYYALAEIEIKAGNIPTGKSLLTKSILVSVSNNRQKAMAYEKLGDFSFQDRAYIKAQKYYDSCATVLPDDYPNAEVIRNKALKLKDLVLAVETAAYEDSVQRIAAMPEAERLAYAEKLVEQIQKEEAERKEKEAIRLKEIQAQQLAITEQQSTSKFFWNNTKMKSDGLANFRKLWGPRENEDDWRRSDKIVIATFKEEEQDTLSEIPEEIAKPDSLSPESLLAKLPIGDSLMSLSTERMLSSLFDAGMIYADLLQEEKMAVQQFEKILDRKAESKYNLLALYQLYTIYEVQDPVKAHVYKTQILEGYPDSDYANYLRDPDYFVKQKELEKLNEEGYLKLLDRYNRGLYSYVQSTSESIIASEPKNVYRPKYYLLNALSLGQMHDDKSKMKPVLEALIQDYPKTPEEARAKELLQLIEKGTSAFNDGKVKEKSLFTFEKDKEHWVIIFLDLNENSMLSKSKVADFNKEFFGKDDLKSVSKMYGSEQSVILIDPFDREAAAEYIRVFKRTKKYVSTLKENKMYTISKDNLKTLFETKNLEEYDLFYTEFY